MTRPNARGGAGICCLEIGFSSPGLDRAGVSSGASIGADGRVFGFGARSAIASFDTSGSKKHKSQSQL